MAKELDIASLRKEFLQLVREVNDIEAKAARSQKRISDPKYQSIVKRMYDINDQIPDGQKFSFSKGGHLRRPQKKGKSRKGVQEYKFKKVDISTDIKGKPVTLEIYKKRAKLKGYTEEEAVQAFKNKERLLRKQKSQLVDAQWDHINPRNPKDKIVGGIEHPRNFVSLRKPINAAKSNKRDLKILKDLGIPLSPEKAADMDLSKLPTRQVPGRVIRNTLAEKFAKKAGRYLPGPTGTAFDAIDLAERTALAASTGNPLDIAQAGVAGVTTALGATGVGEVVAYPLQIINDGVDVVRGAFNTPEEPKRRLRTPRRRP